MARKVQNEKPKAPAKRSRKTASAAGARSGKQARGRVKHATQSKMGTKKPPEAREHAGRPSKYDDPATMAEKIDEYFAGLKHGRKSEPPTMAGLALALGFADRQSLRDYGERDEQYSCLVKKAKLQIEAFHEGRLSGNSPTGSICWLNNHAGYVQRQELTGAGGGPIQHRVEQLTHEQALARLAELRAEDA